MGVDDADTMPRLDVLNRHVLQKNRLSGAGFADYVDVAAPVFKTDMNRPSYASIITVAYKSPLVLRDV